MEIYVLYLTLRYSIGKLEILHANVCFICKFVVLIRFLSYIGIRIMRMLLVLSRLESAFGQILSI